jgi:hypothetical protein
MELILNNAELDILFPARALLSLSSPGGGQLPLAHVPGVLRPLAASLGVVPAECGKHDTTATRWNEDKATQKSRDGIVEPDTVSIQHTDT